MLRTTLSRSVATGMAASASQRQAVAAAPSLLARSKHTLPDLPYGYDALEPHIPKQIMEIHHSKHHYTYVTNLNAAEEALATATAKGDVSGVLATQSAVKFNGGGHLNHTLFWQNLAPESQGGGKLPSGPLKSAIERDFGSFDEFKARFAAAAAGLQGSGWVWLGVYNGRLDIAQTKDQDPLLSHKPILGLDLWEHAYYLKYLNLRPKYVEAMWNVYNWKMAEERFVQAQQQ